MKNKLSVVIVLLALFLVGTACSLGGLTGGSDESDSGSTAEKTEKAKGSDDSSSSSSSGEKVLESGIPECDELAQYVEDNSEELEGSFVGRTIILLYKNTILKAIEDGAKDMDEEQKKKMGETCAKTLKQMKESQEK